MRARQETRRTLRCDEGIRQEIAFANFPPEAPENNDGNGEFADAVPSGYTSLRKTVTRISGSPENERMNL